MIRVLVVDDSALVRAALSEVLNSDPEIEVIGTAGDPFAAAKLMASERPDVITLDIEMPRMDGLTFLERIMAQHPIPVVMCSSLTEAGCASALRALECGAVAIITKPKLGVKEFIEDCRVEICDAIRAAAAVHRSKLAPRLRTVEPKLNADAVLARATSRSMIQTTEKVVIIGASTGGTQAIREILMALPADCPGIVIVLHMPEKFTAAFADRLNRECAIIVREAKSTDTVLRGTALIAPGNMHTMLKRSGARYYVDVVEGPLVCRHRPSVDVLFRSAARYAGANAVGFILTGMGDDGARGLLEMKEAKAKTYAQDEESCIVFGMPGEAIKLGGVDKVIPLTSVASEIMRHGG